MELPVDYTKLSSYKRRKVRLQYEELQKGKCAHCEGLLSEPSLQSNMEINLKLFPIGFLKHPVHLHHCHHTGMTIGAVHAHCNAVLWQYLGE